MARLGVAILGLVLVATAARAQTLGETSAAMGVQNGLAGTAVQRTPAMMDRMRSAANPAPQPNAVGILADYGRRVASEQAAKSSAKGAWAAAGELGGKNGGGTGKSWETARTAAHGSSGGNSWAKNDKGTRTPSRQR